MRPDNIYLASRYSRKDEMIRVAQELQEEWGVHVTSRWLQEKFSENATLSDLTIEESTEFAQVDLDDIIASDTMIFFAEDSAHQPPRGGRHVEFGYALAQGVRVLVVGGKENIFHYLPHVTHYSDFAELVEKELLI